MDGHQDVILPNAALFLVDRSWDCRQKNRTAANSSSIEISLSSLVPNTTTKVTFRPVLSQETRKATISETAQPNSPRRGNSNAKTFEFINATQPGIPQTAEVRTLIKRHVKSGIKQRRGSAREKDSTVDLKPTASVLIDEVTGSSSPEVCLPTCDLPISLSPISRLFSPFYGRNISDLVNKSRSEELLNFYLNQIALDWYPLERYLTFNPVREQWFPLALNDEYFFQAAMFTAASHFAIDFKLKHWQEATEISLPIFRHITERLRDQMAPSETVAGIISCLAMVEISTGNYDKWKLHITAIKNVIDIRGGINGFDFGLQPKLLRADIEGAIHTMKPAIIPITDLHRLSTSLVTDRSAPHVLSSFSATLLKTLQPAKLSQDIQDSFLDLADLTYALNRSIATNTPLNVRSYDEDIMFIDHALLSIPFATNIPLTTCAALQEAMHIVALLYVTSISKSMKPYLGHCTPIMQRLITVVDCLAGWEPQEESLSLLVWICTVGAITARYAEQNFFGERLGKVLGLGKRNLNWEDVKARLVEVLWVDVVHDVLGKTFWDTYVVVGQTFQLEYLDF